MSDSLPIIRPLLGEEEADAVAEALRSGWVTQGPRVLAFEEEFAAFVGARHACAVANCTAALHLSLLAAGVGPGDEVITVSHSFVATANCIRFVDALPVFIDIERQTYNLDPAKVEGLIGERTRAILAVHQMGMPADLARLLPIAEKHGLPVIEDAACAIGSEIDWRGEWQKIGRPHGKVACFSFHPRKLLTTGDGGMLTTHDADWDARFRRLRHHGMTVPDTVRHGAHQVVFESYDELAYNYRLTDIQAAVGRVQLGRLPAVVQRRRALAEQYFALLGDIPGLELPVEPPWARTNWQSLCVRLPPGCDQIRVMQHLLDAGVASRRGIMCAHREPAYRQQPWSCAPGTGRTNDHSCSCGADGCRRLVESELAQEQAILLPLFDQMTLADLERVAAKLRTAIAQAD